MKKLFVIIIFSLLLCNTGNAKSKFKGFLQCDEFFIYIDEQKEESLINDVPFMLHSTSDRFLLRHKYSIDYPDSFLESFEIYRITGDAWYAMQKRKPDGNWLITTGHKTLNKCKEVKRKF